MICHPTNNQEKIRTYNFQRDEVVEALSALPFFCRQAERVFSFKDQGDGLSIKVSHSYGRSIYIQYDHKIPLIPAMCIVFTL